MNTSNAAKASPNATISTFRRYPFIISKRVLARILDSGTGILVRPNGRIMTSRLRECFLDDATIRRMGFDPADYPKWAHYFPPDWTRAIIKEFELLPEDFAEVLE